ncbi:hypothetical protein [Amycolatopsis sp. NPDC004079]
MGRFILVYENYGIVVYHCAGSTGYVDWVVWSTDGQCLARHREPAPEC